MQMYLKFFPSCNNINITDGDVVTYWHYTDVIDRPSPWIWKGVSARVADTPFHIQGDEFHVGLILHGICVYIM